jgi:glycosyltransferase involved in cell wall biosynthesis
MFYEDHVLIDAFKAENCGVVAYCKPKAKSSISSPLVLKPLLTIFRKVLNFFSLVIFPIITSIAYLFKNDVDLIHLNNNPKSVWDWLLAAKLFGKKCITHDRGSGVYNWSEKTMANVFDRILCVSVSILDNLRKNGIDKKTIVLYDGLDAAGFHSRIKKSVDVIKEEFNIGSNAPFIGVVGNIQFWKGQHIIIRAVDILRLKYPMLTCLLVGAISPDKNDSEYYEELKKEISEKKLAGNVILTGYRGDVPDIMNALDIIIHSSIEPEPFGMVVLEGMSLKKPVIAANIGGPVEIIEDGISGFLVPPNEPGIVAGRIDVLLQDQGLRQRIGDNALRRVEEKFNLELFSKALNNVYTELFS